MAKSLCTYCKKVKCKRRGIKVCTLFSLRKKVYAKNVKVIPICKADSYSLYRLIEKQKKIDKPSYNTYIT